MQIIDAHFHLWDLDQNYYPWLCDGDRPSVVPNYESLRRNYLVSDFMKDSSEFELLAAVHIQAEHDPTDHVGETRWLQSVANDPKSRGIPQAIVANVDLAAGDAQAVLEGHLEFPNLRGLRQALHRRLDEAPAYDPLLDPAWQHSFPLVKRYELSFDLQFFPEQGADVIALVRKHSDVQFILTHCGMPYFKDEARFARWQRNMATLATFPNVAVKISGFGMFDADWNSTSIRPLVVQILDRFGIDRCLFASNFPVEGIVKPYAETWHAYAQCLNDVSETEKAALFRENARRLYRLP